MRGEVERLPPARRKAELVAALRRRSAGLERGAPAAAVAGAVCFGVPAVDAALPQGGLSPAALHEVLGAGDGAATAFAAALAARRALLSGGMVLWCARDADLYGPGLAAYGLAPDRLLLVRGGTDKAVLWAMEEGLRCASLAAVVGEVRRLGLTASRRLQLAAESHAVMAILLRPQDGAPEPTAAATRWRVSAAASEDAWNVGVGPARWRAELLRCRGGVPRSWLLEWRHETHRFALAAALADGPAGEAAAARARAAGS